MKVQVSEGYYLREKYTTLKRFISYFYQIDVIRRCRPERILLVGVGDGTVSHFLKQRYDVTTVDIDKSIGPDVVGDIQNMPFKDGEFDITCAFEVLEHLPFDNVEGGLKEMARVSRRHIAVSLPHRSADFEVVLRFPLMRTLLKRDILRFHFGIPLSFPGFESSGQHYWEIDRQKTPLTHVRSLLSRVGDIQKEIVPPLDTYHRFFLLTKHIASGNVEKK
ncbi:class I SAM-dependent methyltransferase [Candidatus Wolfebacteria bacterium]|nr:class I SAM-dependent methyltransferase [Candidatus Wolfebacteria bacterium]